MPRDRVERDARLLERVPPIVGNVARRKIAEALAAAGLTLAPLEPDEARLLKMAEEMANQLFIELGRGWFHESERERFIADTAPTLLGQARAAWRAGVGVEG